jgi:Xaa-Pro dipeptidase
MASPRFEFVPEQAFPVEEHRRRLAALEERIAARGLDGAVVHVPENILYLSGWHTPGYYYPQFLVVRPGRAPIIVLRALEAIGLPVRAWVPQDDLITFADTEQPILKLRQALERLGLLTGRVGLETHGWYFTVKMHQQLLAACPDLRVEPTGWLVEDLRKVKSSAEVAYIREACRHAEIGMQAAVDSFRVGMTEAELSGHIHKAMVEAGCEYVGLPQFVMSGYRQLAPHSVWSKDKTIVPGENVFLELCGSSARYAGALFRTLVVGPPSSRNEENMAVAEAMLDASIAAIRPGVTAGAVNDAVGTVAERHGVLVRKRCGYSLGLNFAPDWGEGFFLELADGDPTELRPGMVFHLPETVRRPGEPLVAVSETVLVTETGCEPLTRFRRGLIQVG